MGCCFSLSRDNDHPQYATEASNEERPAGSSFSSSSSAAATTATTAPGGIHRASPHGGPRVLSNSHHHHHRHHRYFDHNTHTQNSSSTGPTNVRLPLEEHFNAPIRLHIWHSKRRRWTRALLDQERKEFFETRVTGRPEIWAALSAALSLMRAGDLSTAQSIIDAAGITVPTGDFCQGCYDEQGALYRLPQCIVSDPENIVCSSSSTDNDDEDNEDNEDDGGLDFETDDGKISLDKASGDELVADEDVEHERRRDEKGKTSERDLIRVKARLSDRDGPDIIVSVGKTQNVGFIARKVQQEAGISKDQRVKIVYLGRMLKEHSSLIDQGWKQGHVINALVVTRHPLS